LILFLRTTWVCNLDHHHMPSRIAINSDLQVSNINLKLDTYLKIWQHSSSVKFIILWEYVCFSYTCVFYSVWFYFKAVENINGQQWLDSVIFKKYDQVLRILRLNNTVRSFTATDQFIFNILHTLKPAWCSLMMWLLTVITVQNN